MSSVPDLQGPAVSLNFEIATAAAALPTNMAASSYLLELDERRERLLAEVVDHLGVPSGSAEHELALSFAASSLAHHDQMDAESNKVAPPYM